MNCSNTVEYGQAKLAAERFNLVFFPIELNEFLSKEILEDGLYHVVTGNKPLDLIIKRGDRFEGRGLLAFNGALSERARSLNLIPNFSGVAIAKEIGVTLVAIADPAVYLDSDVRIGWYLGWKDFNVQKIIIAIVAHLAESLKVKFCACGGSGGGFASLYFLANSPFIDKAFVWNCQTVVEKYHKKFWNRLAIAAFGCNNVSEKKFSKLMVSCDISSSLFNEINKIKNKSFVYLQNKVDWHFKIHAMPFIESLNLEQQKDFLVSDQILFFKGHWGENHAVPPRELIISSLLLYLDGNIELIKKKLFEYK